jgi:hypothetical protein
MLRHEDVWGSGCRDPSFLNLCTNWRWVVSFTPRPLYPRGKSHSNHWIRVGWTPEPIWTTWRSENSCPYRDSNSDPLIVQPVASRYPGSYPRSIWTNFLSEIKFDAPVLSSSDFREVSRTKRSLFLFPPYKVHFQRGINHFDLISVTLSSCEIHGKNPPLDRTWNQFSPVISS